VLRQAIQGISDLILVPGLINLDFADVKTIMSGMGLAMMGTGVAEGQERAVEAARRAISSPLLEGASVNGARGVIINVTGGPDLSLVEVSDASTIVQEAADEDANIIFGAVVDPALKGKVKITVIATGFGPAVAAHPAPSAAQTPVDLSHYGDLARARVEASVERPPAARLAIARRPLFDLPLAASAGAASGSAAEGGNGQSASSDPDFDLSSTLDVPAFLRRQEG
jgi:cell division protein FtsZ